MKKILLITVGLSVALFADFTKSSNIVKDSTTGLEWQDDAIGSTKTWADGIEYCENLTLDTHSDWRLPNIRELTSIVDDRTSKPSIDTTVFQNTASAFYWSSTRTYGVSWRISFYLGFQDYWYTSSSYYVRCVRAGQ